MGWHFLLCGQGRFSREHDIEQELERVEREDIWVLGGKVWWWLRWSRGIVAVSNGPFLDLLQEIFHSKMRSIGTTGVHFKVNHRPQTYFLSAALCSATCEKLCWFKKERASDLPLLCRGISLFIFIFVYLCFHQTSKPSVSSTWK